jgi:hypothetical protein
MSSPACQAAERGAPAYHHPGEGAYFRRMNWHFERMALQYRQAAFRPWVAQPEEPDMIEGAVNSAPQWRGQWR